MSEETETSCTCCGLFSRRSATSRRPRHTPQPSSTEGITLEVPKSKQQAGSSVRRRSRSDSPLPEGEAQAPLKRQNSMPDEDDLAPRSSPARGEAGAGGNPARAADSAASSGTQQQASASEQPSSSGAAVPAPASPRQQVEAAGGGEAGLPGAAALLHGCPPYGTKSVIGRRPKMEDACVAVPYLAEVPVLEAALDELLPPRIAPQLRGNAAELGLELRGSGRVDSSAHAGTAPASDAVETLHFFGVFDGHGGADAAMHCARTLHERVREVLSACVTPGTSAAVGGPLPSVADLSQSPSQAREGAGGNEEGGDASSSGFDPSAATAMDTGASGGGDPSPSPFAAAATQHQQRQQQHQQPDPLPAGASASSDNSSSYLECVEEDAGEGGKVVGVACTTETIEAALTKAFHITDEEFGNMGGYEHLALVGTTAVVALLGTRMIYVANCGDSRAVLSRNGTAVPLTDDHKAAREDETARVEAAGGQILFWNGVRVMGLLAVSRAIGDHSLRPYVIAEPEVTVINRHASDELLVMASDGLWDVMTNQEACTLAKKCLQRARQRGSSRQSAARVAATVLTRAAVDRGSRDNVTVVIVDLSPATEAELAAEAAERRRSEQRSTSAAAQESGEGSTSRLAEGRELQHSNSSNRRRQSAEGGGEGNPHRTVSASADPNAPPPVAAPSPFATGGALDNLAASRGAFADRTTQDFPQAAAVQPAASPFAPTAAAGDSGENGARGSGEGSGDGLPPGELPGPSTSAQRAYTALVSPFASGALPEGLDFDVEDHAARVAAATAQLAESQQQRGGNGSDGGGGVEPMQTSKE